MSCWRFGPACAIGMSLLVATAGANAEMILPARGTSEGAAARGAGDGPGFSAVAASDTASVALRVYATQQISLFLNAGGDASIQRGGAFKDIGAAPAGYGTYTVQAYWDEFVAAVNTVQIIWKTSNGQRFIPAGATIQGQPVQFLEWRVGATNPITFWPWITSVNLVSATISASTNGGATLTTTDITGSVSNPWNGTSFGTTLPASFFNNANYIEATFTYVPIPAPASAGAVMILGAGLGAVRGGRARRGGG